MNSWPRMGKMAGSVIIAHRPNAFPTPINSPLSYRTTRTPTARLSGVWPRCAMNRTYRLALLVAALPEEI